MGLLVSEAKPIPNPRMSQVPTSIDTSHSRSYLRRVKSKDTTTELLIRRGLWRQGFRYRLHYARLPGKPDIVFPSKKLAVFIHGCYWHRHNCKRSFKPKTNTDFWSAKFENNVRRDAANKSSIESFGWKVLTLWECEIKKDLDKCLAALTSELELAKRHRA